jgi:hypothetical protein
MGGIYIEASGRFFKKSDAKKFLMKLGYCGFVRSAPEQIKVFWRRFF